VLALLVYRLHHGTDYPSKDRAAARATKRISDQTAHGPGGGRIGTRSTPKETTKKGASSDTADRATNDLGQLTHRHLLQDRANRLTAENAGNDLNDNRKYRFHLEPPSNTPRMIGAVVNTGPSYAIGQAQKFVVHCSQRSVALADGRIGGFLRPGASQLPI
jgi:hypothetical protein